jgi:adenylate cyclase
MADTERKLLAILSADVVGYSRLMADDEGATVRTVSSYREQVATLIGESRGRLADFTGDNFLAEFPTATEAVQSAAEIQRVIAARNAAVPEQRKMEFRIGVHLGEVRVEGGQLYGDGVNIAARLEALAPPGGICVSESVRSEVRDKLGLPYRDLGTKTVKNIPEPVHAYAIDLGGAPAARGSASRAPRAVAAAVGLLAIAGVVFWSLDRREQTASPPPATAVEAPDLSVAVLPFTNMSGDPEQEYFSDGMTEDLITDLSQVPGLLVIARNSSFTYKGRAVNVTDVGRELGVRYVLEGSVRKAGERVRVNAQLIDAATGHHLWAQRYDRQLEDIFAVQDELTATIVAELELRLAVREDGRPAPPPTDDPEAYDLFLRASSYFTSASTGPGGELLLQAQENLARAIERDPDFGRAHALLGMTYIGQWVGQQTDDPASVTRAVELAGEGVRLSPTDSGTLSAAGMVYQLAGMFDEALAAVQRAIELNPNDASAYRTLGIVLNHHDRPQDAMAALEEARRRDPVDPSGVWQFQAGVAAAGTGKSDEGLRLLRECARMNDAFIPCRIALVRAYHRSGDLVRAREVIGEIRRIQPHFSIDKWAARLPFRGGIEDVVEAWRAAERE